MESRERVLEAVKERGGALGEVDEVWKSDHEVVLTAVQRDGLALQFAAEALKGDCKIVLAAVQQSGYALEHASEALRADRDVVLAAVQQSEDALHWAADDLLEDATFATEAKGLFYLLKLTMLSGSSTVVVVSFYKRAEDVLAVCRRRLGLAVDGSALELCHGSERVPDDDTEVQDWPGIQPEGQISEYQLLVKQ
eukprot:5130989-Amphidinium_carterae.1